MGDLIKVNFKKKTVVGTKGRKKKDTSFPMVFNEAGFGLNPSLLKRVHIMPTGLIYMFFKECDKNKPQCSLYTPNFNEACANMDDFAAFLKETYDIDLEITYESKH